MNFTKCLLALGLSMASSASIAKAAPSNEELKIGITQEFENLNPLIGSMAATSYMLGLSVHGWLNLTPDGKYVPTLAKSIPTIENKGAKIVQEGDKKKLISTWEFVDNAKWGDGTPITCADVKFAWETAKNPNVSVGSREGVENIESIVWDEKTPTKCVITQTKAKFDYFREIPGPLPRHIEEAVVKQFGSKKEGYDQNSNYTKNPTNPGLYNGQYVVSEIKLGSHVSFVPNPYYYGKKPVIKKIIFKLIPNTSTLEANLRSGTIDMVSPLGFAFDQALAFDKKVKAEKLPFQVVFKPSITYEHIDLNLENPLLTDVKVRQALVYGINREELVKALFEGKQPVALHNVSPGDAWFTNDPKKISTYKFDKKKAMQLLDEAGFKPGADGIRAKDGQRLSLQFMTTAGNKTRETVQTFLQAQWKAIGVEVLIKNEPARVFFSETANKRKYGGMAMFAWISSPESSPRSNMHSKMITSEANSWSGQNYTGWKNEKVDSYIDALEIEFNPAKRKELAHKILKEYTTDVPVIPLYYRSDIAVIPTNMKGYRLAGHQSAETSEVENWTFGSALK